MQDPEGTNDGGSDQTPDQTRELVLAAQGGDSSAMEALLLQHLSSLRAFVHMKTDGRLRVRESQSDLVQSICREVLSSIGKLDYRNEAAFKSWLFTLAQNKLREKGRFHAAARRDLKREDSFIGGAEGALEAGLCYHYSSMLSPSQHAESNESIQRFEAAFDRLSPDHQQVVLLSRVLRQSHAQIAEHMGRTQVATRRLLSRALVALSKELGPEGPLGST
jgi:RNA polymerase sigma-70 factor, ECF subfamily